MMMALGPAAFAFVLAAAAVLIVRALFHGPAEPPTRSRRRARLALVAAWAATVGFVHARAPAGHRLHFDEDAYANLALNLSRGRGAVLTVAQGPDLSVAVPYKWPVGFPTAAAPWVAAFGPERGPRLLNEACGAVTLAALMALAVALGGHVAGGLAVAPLFGAQAVLGAWHRAGAAEPLALALVVTALLAATRARAATEARAASRLTAGALVAAAAAAAVRMDYVVAVPAVLIALRGPLRLELRDRLLAAGLGAAAVWLLASHAAGLHGYYLAGRPESDFAATYVRGNLDDWRSFLRESGLAAWLTGAACAGALAAARSPTDARRGLAALVVAAAGHAAVLAPYSAARLSGSGGTRFLLLVLALSLVGVAALVGRLVAASMETRGRAALAAAGGVALAATALAAAVRAPSVPKSASAAAEHAAITAWAAALPPDAVVRTRLPFVWDNLGHAAVTPELESRLPDGAARFGHRGLMDTLAPTAPRPVREPLATIVTEHGSVTLDRLDSPSPEPEP
jgi:hypothetical protein